MSRTGQNRGGDSETQRGRTLKIKKKKKGKMMATPPKRKKMKTASQHDYDGEKPGMGKKRTFKQSGSSAKRASEAEEKVKAFRSPLD